MSSNEALLHVVPPAMILLVLATVFLPIPRWQSLLLWLLSQGLRLAGLAVVALGGLVYFGWLRLPPELAGRLGILEPWQLLSATGLVVVVLLMLVAFLDFTRRLLRTSRDTQALLRDQRTAAALLAQLLDRSGIPGASLTAERRAELEAALAQSAGQSPSGGALGQPLRPRNVVRKTLAQLLK